MIVGSWVLTALYIVWANRHYDPEAQRLRERLRSQTLTAHAAASRHLSGSPTASAVTFFLIIVALTLAITWWAARRTRSTSEFYAAGRSVTALENGLALAGDYMSAASFLGIAGLVALRGYDGMIYATGWLVGWPALMFLIAEPVRNLGKYTFADVVAFRLRQVPVQHRLCVRRHPDRALLHHRADGRRREPDSPAVRHSRTSGRSPASGS